MRRMRLINLMLCSLVITASAWFNATALAQQSATGARTEHQTEPAQNSRQIAAIRFVGNHRLSSLQLAKLIGLKAGDMASTKAIDAALSKIVAAYRSRGADLAVRAEISTADSNRCHLLFVIDEQGTGGSTGTAVRSGARMGGAPPPPPPATRQ